MRFQFPHCQIVCQNRIQITKQFLLENSLAHTDTHRHTHTDKRRQTELKSGCCCLAPTLSLCLSLCSTYMNTDSFRALLLAVSALARYLPLSLLVSPSLSASHSPFVLASGGCLCFLQDFPLHNALKNKLWLWLVLAPLRPDKYATICYFPLLSIRSVYAIFAHNRISVIDFASPCRIASQRIDSRYGIAFGAKHASPIVITIRSPRPLSLSSTRTTRLNARICLLMCDRYGVRECHYVSVCVHVRVRKRVFVLLFYHCFRAALRCICVDSAFWLLFSALHAD